MIMEADSESRTHTPTPLQRRGLLAYGMVAASLIFPCTATRAAGATAAPSATYGSALQTSCQALRITETEVIKELAVLYHAAEIARREGKELLTTLNHGLYERRYEDTRKLGIDLTPLKAQLDALRMASESSNEQESRRRKATQAAEDEQIEWVIAHRLPRKGFSSQDSIVSSTGSLFIVPQQYDLQIWDLQKGNLVTTLQTSSPNTWLRSLDISGDGSKVMALWEDGLIKLWDARTQTEEIIKVPGNTPIRGLLSKAGDQLFLLTDTATVRRYDTTFRGFTGTFWSGRDAIHKYRLNADGTKLLTGSGEKTLVWDVNSESVDANFPAGASQTLALLFSPDEKLVITQAVGVVEFWDIASNTQSSMFKGSNIIQAFAFSRDGGRAVIAYENENTKVWNAGATGQLDESWEFPDPAKYYINSLEFSPNGEFLLVVATEILRPGTQTSSFQARTPTIVSIIKTKTGKILTQFDQLHEETKANFSGDGKTIVLHSLNKGEMLVLKRGAGGL